MIQNLKLFLCGFLMVVFIGITTAEQVCEAYDDFSSGSLDTNKWEIRQDVEGQPFMDEYGVLNESGFVFHTQQNIIEDRRVYLFPKRTFTTGDTLNYDVNLISREGTYANMVLLTGGQYIRIGMRGTSAGFDELGVAHMQLEFQENNLHILRETPSGSVLVDDLTLTNSNGTYEFYIGSFSGSNGAVHMDYDNFVVCVNQPDINLEERVEMLEQRVNELENRTSLLESIVNKIVDFINAIPEGLRKDWVY